MKNNKNTKNMLMWGIVLALVLCLPHIIRNDYWMVVFVRVLINIVLVLGLNLITGLIGQMNLGSAGIYALGAYSSALFVKNTGLSPWLGLLVAVATGIVIGLVLGYPSLRLKGVYFSLTTIGFTQVVQIFLNNMTKVTGGSQGLKSISPYSLFGFIFDSYVKSYYLYVVFVLIAIFCAVRIVNSKWGRLYRSLRDNSDAVEMSGINIADVKVKAFIAAAIFGTVAGAMYAYFYGYISPSTYTVDISMNFVLMLLVGGIGSVSGAMFGAVIVTILPELLRGLGNYYLITFYIIIFLGILFFPNGWVDAAVGPVKKLIAKKKKEERAGGEK